MLSLRDESPAGENRKWNAGRRARPQAEGGASRLFRGASRTPLACGQKTMRLPAFRFLLFFVVVVVVIVVIARSGSDEAIQIVS